jgi:hypothetical protein
VSPRNTNTGIDTKVKMRVNMIFSLLHDCLQPILI